MLLLPGPAASAVAAAGSTTTTIVAVAARAAARALAAVAIGAVDRLVVARLKRNLRLFATSGTDSRVHLAITACSAESTLTAGRFVGGTAIGASAGLIREALLSVEFLLAGRKCEILATITALQCFVLHVVHASPKYIFSWNFSFAAWRREDRREQPLNQSCLICLLWNWTR